MFIVTSFSPHPDEEKRQRAALATWQAAGFKALSLNLAPEIDPIRSLYPDLTAVEPVKKTSAKGSSKPRVALADLIERSFEKNQGKFGLVMNADLLLHSQAKQRLPAQPRGVTMLPRWQITHPGGQDSPEMDPWGYDGVFLGPELRGVFQNRSFGLGLPWWDYWIPFRALHLAHAVHVIPWPIAFHVRHDTRWDEQDRARLASEVWREVGVPPWKRMFLRTFGPRHLRKIYGYHNHLAGHIRATIQSRLPPKTHTPPSPVADKK